jgi:hypothetical protein
MVRSMEPAGPALVAAPEGAKKVEGGLPLALLVPDGEAVENLEAIDLRATRHDHAGTL